MKTMAEVPDWSWSAARVILVHIDYEQWATQLASAQDKVL